MQQYLDLVRHTLEYGEDTPTRTGVNARTVFGEMVAYDLREGFPILTTKKVLWPTVVDETLWFLRGGHNVNDSDAPRKIWNDWRVPYRLKRKFVLVAPRIRPYVEYFGDFAADCFVGSDEDSFTRRAWHTWHNMLKRCYCPNAPGYVNWGGKGVSVCSRWHSFSNFLEDIPKLPHWWYKERSWDTFELDKDYYGANQYGPDTCIWAHEREQIWYSSSSSPLRVVNLDGEEFLFMSIRSAAETLKVSHNTIMRWLKVEKVSGILGGKNEKYRGWLFEPVCVAPGALLRLSIIADGELGVIYGQQWRNWGGTEESAGIDQLQIAIDRVKNEPNSRRNIVSAWNVGDVDNMALPPCHMSFQFRRFGNYLDLAMYQRSADLALGVPMNIASYALLLSMVAHECGLTARRFVHFLADCHIYENHLAGLKTQLGRIPGVPPTLRFSCPIGTPVVEMTKDMIHLDNYNPQPFIKFEVAV